MSFRRLALSCLLVVLLTGVIPLVKVAAQRPRFSHQLRPLYADPGNHRLPKDVFPTRYTIRLEPTIGPDHFTFQGEIEIEIYIPWRTTKIVLHAESLVIEEQHTELLYANSSKVNVAMTSAQDANRNFYKLQLSTYVLRGHYILRMKYSGLLHDDLRGFYRDSYINDEGHKVWFATTLFQPTFARRAFPCFDEPSFKATFKIFITHPNAYKAISNMPAMSEKTHSEDTTKMITEFRETPMMSTFLVAFSVSDFHYFSVPNGSFRIFAVRNKLRSVRFAAVMSPRILAKMVNYTKIDYQLPKMDKFVTPRFSAPGMENWGLVRFRESAFLYDEKHTTTEAKHEIVKLLSHEFAHQWFGNLVTPSWWSFSWLSEGFAHYFEYWITDQLEPSWRMMDQFVIETLQKKAFAADDNEAQIPMDITTTLNDTDKILKTAFNRVTYGKASCVIRMFVHVLTPTVFQTGLQNYLRNKSYQTVTSGDLIRELAAVGKDIKFLDKALLSWITQPGYPVITVMRDYSTGNAVISQKRFLTKGGAARTEQWFVPINFVSKEESMSFSDTKPTHWLRNDTETMTISGLKRDSWVIVNKQQTGYYRVNYDAQNWRLITDYLKNPSTTENIHVLNRAQLLDDAFHLAEAGKLPDHSIFLELTNYLQNEVDYVPWYAAHRAFAVLNRALMNTASYDLYKLYVQRLTAKLEESVGYTEKRDENDVVKMNRVKAIELACAMGSAKCLHATHQMMIAHVYEFKKTSPDLQSVALCAGMRSANKGEWEMAYNYTIRLSTDSEEYRILVNALGCSSDQEILKVFLEKGFFMESDYNYADDFVDSVLSGDVGGVDAILAFTKEKFQSIVDIYYWDAIATILTDNANRMTTQKQMTRLQDFIDTLPAGNWELVANLRDHAVRKANEHIESVKKYQDTAAQFLNAQNLIREQNHDEMQHNL